MTVSINGNGTITGATISQQTLGLGTNSSTLVSGDSTTRVWTLPDKTGTVAMTSDITGGTQAGSFTTLSATGWTTATNGTDVTTTTSSAYNRMINSSGAFYVASDSSAGNSFAAGGVAYAANYYLSYAAPHIWSTAGIEKMRLDVSGNLGLGVTPSATGGGQFQAPSVNISSILGTDQTAYVTNGRQTAYGDFKANWVYRNSAAASSYAQLGGQHIWSTGTAGDPISFATAMTLDASGVLSLAKGQLQFPATQVPSANVNTLDDYEEGTWTPTLNFDGGTDGGTVGVTYTTQNGRYTKIGRMVTVIATITLSSKGSYTGQTVRLSGVPFANGSAATSGVVSIATGLIGITSLALVLYANDTVFDITNAQFNYTSLIAASNISATSSLHFTFTYFV